MQVRSHWFWLLLILVFVSLLGVTQTKTTAAQGELREYFPETGHWLVGDFLLTYRSAADPALLYGLPLTDEFVSGTAGGRRVQYFEYARFELRPENPPELRVVKSELGKTLYDQSPPGQVIPLPQSDTGCQFFKETGFQVCYAFLDFFDAYGGIDQFGYPVSDLEQHETFAVQYFQFARLEWHPEQPIGQQVTLTDVGRRYFNTYEDPRRARPVTDGAPHIVLDLQVQAYVSQPVMLANGEQTVFVVVQDQSLAPVAGAEVTIFLRQTTLSVDLLTFPQGKTDAKGIARITFPMRDQANGLVEIVVTASYEGLKKKTITSYRVWW